MSDAFIHREDEPADPDGIRPCCGTHITVPKAGPNDENKEVIGDEILEPRFCIELWRQDHPIKEKSQRAGCSFRLPDGKKNPQYLNRLLDALMAVYRHEALKIEKELEAKSQ